MSSEKMLKARQLMDAGKYSQARAALRGVKDPKAERMLAEIDDLAPEVGGGGGGARDVLHVILMALVFTALFAGVGYVIAEGQGIPRSAVTPVVNVPQATQVPGTNGENVAVEPTAIPTATEIPCEAAAWWEQNRAALNNAITTVLTATVQTPGGQINDAKNAFTAWKAAFESDPGAPCVARARQSILNAAPRVEAVFDSYLSATTDQQRALIFIQAMDALLPSADAVTELNVATPEDSWISTVQDFTNSECPARRWYVEIIQGKAYPRFFELFKSLDFTQVGTANSMLREMQTLRASFQSDSATFPACVKAASDQLLTAMQGFIDYGSSRLNSDMGRADAALQTGNNALTSFYTELGRVEPTLGSVRFQ
jgi:hypothetical protein